MDESRSIDMHELGQLWTNDKKIKQFVCITSATGSKKERESGMVKMRNKIMYVQYFR